MKRFVSLEDSRFESLAIRPVRASLYALERRFKDPALVTQDHNIETLVQVARQIGPTVLLVKQMGSWDPIQLINAEVDAFINRHAKASEDSEVIRGTCEALKAIIKLMYTLAEVPSDVVVDLSKATHTPPPVRPVL